MNITIAAATRFEIKEELLQTATAHNICFLYTGVGILSSAVSLTQHVFQQKPDLIIQAGIAGCFDTNLQPGDVVVVGKEYVGDIGVWEKEEWKDVFDMNFQQPNEAPYNKKSLPNNWLQQYNVLQLTVANGVTVNEISTDVQRIEMAKTKYNAQVETMEGASLHYVCNLLQVPFMQVRGISNNVGERDKTKWQVKAAIENVNRAVHQMLALF